MVRKNVRNHMCTYLVCLIVQVLLSILGDWIYNEHLLVYIVFSIARIAVCFSVGSWASKAVREDFAEYEIIRKLFFVSYGYLVYVVPMASILECLDSFF